MATGIRTNLEWLRGLGHRAVHRAGGGSSWTTTCARASRTSTRRATWREGANLVTGAAEVHAIEPTAQEHGRVVGANMAGRDVAYRGSLLMNIVEVCHLDVASLRPVGRPDGRGLHRRARRTAPAYRKLLFHGDRLTGAMILGPADDIWTTNDVGHAEGPGLVAASTLGRGRRTSQANPFDIKPAFIALAHDRAAAARDHPRRPAVPARPQAAPKTRWRPYRARRRRSRPSDRGAEDEDRGRRRPPRRLCRQAPAGGPLHRARPGPSPGAPDEMREYVGGIGLGAKILYDEVRAEVALGPSRTTA